MSAIDPERHQDGEPEAARQFIVFHVGGEEYGVDALRVVEITGVSAITRVPRLPRCVRGVTNLRGTIVPVMDLRLRLGFPEAEYNRHTAMIVLQLDEGAFGIVTDTVSDILSLPEAALLPPRDMGIKAGAGLIESLGTVEDRMVMLLNVDRLIYPEEMGGIRC